MDMPMSVQADALQVLPAPVPTDYVVVVVNVISILLSVYLGYWLSERQRAKDNAARKIDERVRTAESLIYNIRYAVGALSAQRNLVAKWIESINMCWGKVVEHDVLDKLPPCPIHPIDYRVTSQIISLVPNLNLDFVGVINTIESLNAALKLMYLDDE